MILARGITDQVFSALVWKLNVAEQETGEPAATGLRQLNLISGQCCGSKGGLSGVIMVTLFMSLVGLTGSSVSCLLDVCADNVAAPNTMTAVIAILIAVRLCGDFLTGDIM